MSLALATLIYEWRRYLAAVIALACAGLLVLAQVGLFAGIVKAATAHIERARADIMILAPLLLAFAATLASLLLTTFLILLVGAFILVAGPFTQPPGGPATAILIGLGLMSGAVSAAAVTWIRPGSPVDSMRLATFTVSPQTS